MHLTQTLRLFCSCSCCCLSLVVAVVLAIAVALCFAIAVSAALAVVGVVLGASNMHVALTQQHVYCTVPTTLYCKVL